jgi:hypothetical protein
MVATSAACGVTPSELPVPASPREDLALQLPDFPPKPPDADDIVSKSYTLPMTVPAAETILLTTAVFNFHNSPGASHHASLVIVNLPDAVKRLQTVAASGRRAGQLYALCGLWELDPNAARSLAMELATLRDEVVVLDNDVRELKSMAEAAEMVKDYELWKWFRDQKSMEHGRPKTRD